ncbi:MAG: HAD family phosphatase [Candidatus Rokubacteria bacterium]|nr:HAD family phosphatase [Candidatus Rokubacteria bacterium]
MTSSRIEAVILDFGGVLWDMRWDVASALDADHGLPRSSVFETLYRTDAWREIERGVGDPAAWRESAHRALEARARRPLPPLHDRWREAQHAIAPTLALVRALRPPYKVSILSNADATLRHRLEREIRIHDLFDDIVCSAEVGMAKPEPAIFHLAADRLGVAPARCVFVDDWDENVAAAERVGMQAVLFRVDRGDDLRARLGALGVAPAA